jgi:hypothetical protein
MISATDITLFDAHSKALSEGAEDIYLMSPFKIYKDMSSKKKGMYFEMLVEEFLQKKGYTVERASTSDYDRLVNGSVRVEIKGSLLWGTGSHFRWQQIRTQQDYDVICFVAIYPDRIEFLGATKKEVCYNVEVQDANGYWTFNQHGGKKVNSGTFAIDGFPADFSWMRPLEEVLGA